MVKRTSVIGFLFSVLTLSTAAQTVVDVCPYSPQHKTALACLIPDLTQTGASSNLSRFNTTVAQVIGQLPLAAPVSGFVLGFDKKLGIPVEENQNLGSVLTERGNTVGRHKLFLGFTYQRFVFRTIDGTNLSNLPSVYFVQTLHPSGTQTVEQFGASNNSVSANLSQYTGIIAFGLTDRIDISVTIPFERISMAAGNSNFQQAFLTTDTSTNPPTISSSASSTTSAGQSIAGSASGIGDLVFNMKGSVFNGEKSKLALGMEARFPTGDEYNLLGTGAYGVKPYLVFSRLGRITPHLNVGYQWNDFSNLYVNPCHFNGACPSAAGAPLPTLRLPDSLDYSAGADIGIVKRLTFVGDFVGQHYFNAPRVTGLQSLANAGIQGLPLPNPQNPNVSAFNQHQTVGVGTGGVNVDNAALGLKWNPAGRLILSANALIRLDSGSLRPDRFVPLIGVSYRF